MSGGHFDYQEHSSTQQQLNREHGSIPGLGLQWVVRTRNLKFTTSTLFQKGKIQYDGALQNGLPYQTNTDEMLQQILLSVSPMVNPLITPILGLGAWHWKREILPGSAMTSSGNQTIEGLLERYHWLYFKAGASITLPHLLPSSRHPYLQLLSLSWTKPIEAEMEVFLPNRSVTVKPASKTGYILSYGISREPVTLIAFHRRWNFDRSSTVNGVFEPKSQTKISGVKLKLNFF
ncbi:MAG: hypothetical protein KUG83_06855 [Gammaproteobacteria bacterium]|nr:hypothetical protein [Gammaproteobacteria bacterium]